MQAADPGAGAEARGHGGQGGPGALGEAEAAEAAEAAGVAAPQVQRGAGAGPAVPGGQAAPGPGGQAAAGQDRRPEAAAGGPGRHPLHYVHSMPFPSCTEAAKALESLVPPAQFLHGAVRQDVTVNHNVLTIRLTAEDPSQLQVAISACLDHLSLLIQAMTCFVPCSVKPHPEEGA